MRENLHRFFRAARGAGVRVSPAESIDAMRAVANVGFADRGILRDTFLLTLAKTQDEKKALGECFDLFFDQPEPRQPAQESESDDEAEASDPKHPAAGGRQAAGQPTEGLGPLAQMLLSQDRTEIAAAMANASSAASLSDIRYFTQRGIFSGRILDADGHPAPARRSRRTGRIQPRAGGAADRRCWKRCARPFATRFRRRCCCTAARKPKICATRSCATRRWRGSSRGRSSRCAA